MPAPDDFTENTNGLKSLGQLNEYNDENSSDSHVINQGRYLNFKETYCIKN